MSEELNGFGTLPAQGKPISGETLLPTWWRGNAPMAIPIDGWNAVSLSNAESIDLSFTEMHVNSKSN